MKKMRKLTRRSYNRKLLVFGVSMFMAVAMISTGFAAWVMSSTDPANTNGGVTVGVVNNEMMLIKIDNLDSDGNLQVDPLLFDAQEGDVEGRVTASDGAKDNLSFTISGYVTNAESLSKVKVAFVLPTGLQTAIAQNYIEITSAGAYDAGTGTWTVEVTPGEARAEIADSKEFTYTFTFAWGDFFGGSNPSVFYDSETIERIENDVATDIGGEIDIEQMAAEMEIFAATLRSGLEADDGDPAPSYSGNIAITVSLLLSV